MAESKQVDKAKYRYFGAVINGPKESLLVLDDLAGLERRLHEAEDLYIFLATIIHDKDVLSIDDEKAGRGKAGDPKREHLHAFIDLGEGAEKKTPGQMTDTLQKLFGIERTRISVKGSNSDILLCQYLTHQNHPEKAQYKAEAIKTNSEPLLDEILGKQYVKPKTKEEIEAELFEAIKKAPDIVSLAEQVGIEQANKYRGIFKEIKQAQGQDYEAILSQRGRLIADLSTLIGECAKIINLVERGKVLQRDLDEAKDILVAIANQWDEWINPQNE